MQKYLRFSAVFFGILFFCIRVSAQSGCTDPQATNYSPTATTNDGSCIYPYTHYTPPLKCVLSTTIHESSGVVWTDGKLWSHNDSGDPNEIYNVDTITGEILQTVTVDNYPNVDWEDITADASYIYIGDHGNNNGTRTNLKVLKIAKADIGTASNVHVNAQAISFSYTDQTTFTSSSTNNFDCEALMSVGDSLYMFTKDRGDLHTRVYKMTKTPGTYALTPYTNYNVDGLITGADYNTTTHEVALIGYMSDHTGAFMWLLDDYQGDLFFSGNKRRLEIGNTTTKWQTEGITFMSASRFLISCETTDDVPASVFTVNRSIATSAVANVAGTSASATVYPNPVADELYISNALLSGKYEVLNLTGQSMLAGQLLAGNNTILVNLLVPGMYLLRMQYADGTSAYTKFRKQ